MSDCRKMERARGGLLVQVQEERRSARRSVRLTETGSSGHIANKQAGRAGMLFSSRPYKSAGDKRRDPVK